MASARRNTRRAQPGRPVLRRVCDQEGGHERAEIAPQPIDQDQDMQQKERRIGQGVIRK
jgi:hypothetical protein